MSYPFTLPAVWELVVLVFVDFFELALIVSRLREKGMGQEILKCILKRAKLDQSLSIKASFPYAFILHLEMFQLERAVLDLHHIFDCTKIFPIAKFKEKNTWIATTSPMCKIAINLPG